MISQPLFDKTIFENATVCKTAQELSACIGKEVGTLIIANDITLEKIITLQFNSTKPIFKGNTLIFNGRLTIKGASLATIQGTPLFDFRKVVSFTGDSIITDSYFSSEELTNCSLFIEGDWSFKPPFMLFYKALCIGVSVAAMTSDDPEIICFATCQCRGCYTRALQYPFYHSFYNCGGISGCRVHTLSDTVGYEDFYKCSLMALDNYGSMSGCTSEIPKGLAVTCKGSFDYGT